MKIAPVVFKVLQPVIWLCALVDIMLIISQQSIYSLPSTLSRTLSSTICPHTIQGTSTAPSVHITPTFILGVSLVFLGAALRLTCYQYLGKLFTFDLTIMPSHTLIKSGPYSIVRHPAYTGSLCVMLGTCLVNLTGGSWIAECRILGTGAGGVVTRLVVFGVLYGWWLSVGIYRARAEDGELKKLFGKEWTDYSKGVRWWFVPGLI